MRMIIEVFADQTLLLGFTAFDTVEVAFSAASQASSARALCSF